MDQMYSYFLFFSPTLHCSLPIIIFKTIIILSPHNGKGDLISHSQDPLEVLRAERAGFPERDSRRQAFDDHRAGVALDPLVRHLHGILDAQCLAVLPVEQILDLLPQRVGQVDARQFGF